LTRAAEQIQSRC